ncbi:MAG: magnesium transporter [Hyphomicrobiales bacterium]|nr:magnesium transporter [Hyphomicrobiales bacterium]
MERAQTSEALLRARLEPARILLDADDIDVGALNSTLAMLDGAEISHLLETIPAAQRIEIWTRIDDGLAAEVLDELPDLIASDLVHKTPDERLGRIGSAMNIEQMSDAFELFPDDIQESLVAGLSQEERKRFESAIAYSEDSVGRVMRSDMLVSLESATVNDALEDIRKRPSFPEQTDQLFVTDAHGALIGVVRVNDLLVAMPDTPIAALTDRDPPRLRARETLEDAAALFERDDLVCAPVINRDGRLVGRMAVEEVVDSLREMSEENAFFREGLRSDEDLFGRVWESARRRWLWLSLNLLTAFVASRVIGLFEENIQALVVLATLMPIVASIAGNTGNQTVALVIRGLAMGGITRSNLAYLAAKELSIALINGLIWGGVMGAALVGIYGDVGLGFVMAAAITLNLGVAALVGVVIPLSMDAMGRDPALGSSVVLTFITDSMGFFIFLGLGAVFLVQA